MMFTSTNDLVDPIYSMDLSLPSPLNYFEFDGSILHWNNISQSPFGTNNEPISTSSKMALSKGDINRIVLEQEKGKIISYNHGSNKKKGRVSKRGPSKGDRHSKIPTANGLRDRRMRLSLDVAKQFFKLQDMLSYDKPSKTVKWLLLQAKAAIEELDKGKQSPSSGGVTKSVSSNYSEGEVVESAIDHEDIVKVVAKDTTSKEKSKKKRNFDQFCPVAKQLRKDARERARERTLKKKQALNDLVGCFDEVRNLRPYNMKPCSSDVVFEIEQQIQDEITPFGCTENWSSLMSLSYHQEDDSCKVNPISESQQFHPNLGQYWFN